MDAGEIMPMIERIHVDEDLSKFERYILEIQLALAEYQEVCKNVRTGWEYIVTLLRQFIITQLLLIVAVATFTNDQLYAAILSECTNCPIKSFSLAAAVLMFFGFFFSVFVCFQSYRLFENSREFVSRARAIENTYSVGDKTVHSSIEKKAQPTFTYMEDRLRNPPMVIEMRPILTGTYASIAFFWFVALVTYAQPLIRMFF